MLYGKCNSNLFKKVLLAACNVASADLGLDRQGAGQIFLSAHMGFLTVFVMGGLRFMRIDIPGDFGEGRAAITPNNCIDIISLDTTACPEVILVGMNGDLSVAFGDGALDIKGIVGEFTHAQIEKAIPDMSKVKHSEQAITLTGNNIRELHRCVETLGMPSVNLICQGRGRPMMWDFSGNHFIFQYALIPCD